MSSNLKVLVADDNPDHVQLITEILNQELKAEVEGVTKGEECLEKVKKNRYDLLLLDYLFPKISGLDVLKEIVEKGYDLPVIMITGHGSEKVAVEAMKAGAIDYIVKSEDGFQSLPFVAKKAIEKDQLRKRLRQSEEKFKNLFDSANDAIIYLDKSGRILEVNKQAVDVFGGSKEEVLGKHFTRLGVFAPRDIPTFMSNFANILAGREVTQDVCIKNKKGQEIALECSASLMKTDDKVTGVMVIARDITERKRAEEALRASEQRYRLLFERNLAAVYRTTLDGTVLDCNESFVRLLGYDSREEVMACCSSEFYFDVADREGFIEKLRRQGALTNFEFRMRRKDGSPVWILENVSLIEEEEGASAYLQGTSIDITERKRAEEALRESEEKYRNLIERANDGITIIQDTIVKFANSRLAEMWGGTVEEVVGTPFTDYVHPDELPQVVDRYKRRMAGEDIAPIYETALKRRDGSKVYAELNSGAITFERKLADLVIVRDLTERKRAEESLREQKEVMQTVLENIPVMIAFLDSRGNHKWVNQAWEKNLGWSLAEAQACDILKELYPDPEYYQYVVDFISKAESRWGDFRTRRRDGTVLDTTWTNVLLFDGSNIGIGLDITERKLAEEELRKFKTISEKAGYGVTIVGLEGNVIYNNMAYVSMHGYTRDELIGKHLSIFHTEQHMANVNRLIEKLNREGVYTAEEVWHKRKDNTEFPTLMNGTLIKDENGTPLFMAATAVDITERKRAEEEIHKLNQYLGSIIDNANIWLDVLDEKAQVVIWNKAAEQISGFSREEVVGHGKIWEWLYPDERYRKEITTKAAAIIEKGEMVEDFETTIRCKNEEIKTISWHSRDLLGADGKPIGSIALGRDVTEKKKMEAQLIQSERLAAVGTLAYGIAHEFNNILAGILGNAEFGMGNDDPEETRECFRIIMESCDRAKSITNSLLAFSGQRETKKQRADVTEAVETILGLVERELEKQNIKTVRKFSPIPEIVCDLGELSGVVLNMITNARDAMRPNGGTLTIEIEKKGDNIEIIFTDSGCGIPDSIKSRIFEPFVTTKGALGQSEIPGTGLGLFLSYGIIKRYEGEIGVKSEVGKGSKFTIRIPISKNQVAPALVKGEEEKPMDVPKNLHILLVDDEKPICTAIKKFFEAKGHSVTTALSGKKGLEIFKKGSFDLVLTDITMPDMDGLELISKLKKIDPQLKFIVLTGHITEDMFESAKRAGAHEVLVKPFGNEELYQAIGKIFAI